MEKGQACARAADVLSSSRDEVVRRWLDHVRAEIPTATGVSHPVLVDTVPALIAHLAEALSPEQPRKLATEGSTIPQQHGRERVRVTGFRLRDLVREYQLLRNVVLEVLSEQQAMGEGVHGVVQASLDAAVAEACDEYALASEALRERMVLALAHDLRTPLTAAKMAVALILRRPEDPLVPRWAVRADDSLERVDSMIRTLLDISRAATSQSSLQMAACDLVTLCGEVIESLSLAHGERFVLEARERVTGFWNADALRRAVENLLVNALKYGSPTSPVTVGIERSHGRVTIAVHNEGSYIPPEQRTSLFEIFRRTPAADRSGTRGWGLGLALVQAVAEAHGGSVNVDSLPERGTTFIVDIPLDARPFQSGKGEGAG